MASQQSTVDYLCDQSADAGAVTSRKMFGEYALYCDGKLVGLICDDQFYLKITPPGRALLNESHDSPTLSGAKPHLKVPGEKWDDTAWMSHAVRATADALPAPKPRSKKPQA